MLIESFINKGALREMTKKARCDAYLKRLMECPKLGCFIIKRHANENDRNKNRVNDLFSLYCFLIL